jgi:hypothetical protein
VSRSRLRRRCSVFGSPGDQGWLWRVLLLPSSAAGLCPELTVRKQVWEDHYIVMKQATGAADTRNHELQLHAALKSRHTVPYDDSRRYLCTNVTAIGCAWSRTWLLESGSGDDAVATAGSLLQGEIAGDCALGLLRFGHACLLGACCSCCCCMSDR